MPRINDDTRRNANRIYDFKTGCVKTECLHEGWQTSGSQSSQTAFNLYCNATPSVDDYTDAEDRLTSVGSTGLEELFCVLMHHIFGRQYKSVLEYATHRETVCPVWRSRLMLKVRLMEQRMILNGLGRFCKGILKIEVTEFFRFIPE